MRVYIFFASRIDEKVHAGTLLAEDQHEALEKAMAIVRQEFGPDASVNFITPIIDKIDFRRLLKSEVIKTLSVIDKTHLVLVTIGDVSERMLDLLSHQRAIVDSLIADCRERLGKKGEN